MKRNLMVTVLVALLMAGFVLAYTALRPADVAPAMGAGDGMSVAGPVVPPVRGYGDGEEILFLHTEASDPAIADLLTEMMESPVLVVPALAQVPAEALGNVYVFANGVEGFGPLGFQPDVFDQLPGSEGYTPLRAINRVTWVNPEAARLLTSVAEIKAALEVAEIRIERPGVVVNMPMIRWPEGER